jgi:hypothetical protein
MPEAFYLGAYWGPRIESLDECADRLTAYLARIGRLHHAYTSWFQRGQSMAEASRNRVSVNREAIVRALESGATRSQFTGKIVEDLGYRVGLWNNEDSTPVGFSALCGSDPRTVHVKNCVVLNLPEPESAGAELYSPDLVQDVFRATVECWDPEWATFSSSSMRSLQEQGPTRPVAGWMTYLSGNKVENSSKQRSVECTSFLNGTIVTAGVDPLQMSEVQLAEVINMLTTN